MLNFDSLFVARFSLVLRVEVLHDSRLKSCCCDKRGSGSVSGSCAAWWCSVDTSRLPLVPQMRQYSCWCKFPSPRTPCEFLRCFLSEARGVLALEGVCGRVSSRLSFCVLPQDVSLGGCGRLSMALRSFLLARPPDSVSEVCLIARCVFGGLWGCLCSRLL